MEGLCPGTFAPAVRTANGVVDRRQTDRDRVTPAPGRRYVARLAIRHGVKLRPVGHGQKQSRRRRVDKAVDIAAFVLALAARITVQRRIEGYGDRREACIARVFGTDRKDPRRKRVEFRALEEATDFPLDPAIRGGAQPNFRAPLVEVLFTMLEIGKKRAVAIVERVVSLVIRRTG